MSGPPTSPASLDLRIWQLADSAFPTGGFAHSFGLESAWQFGEVPDVDALTRFVDASVLQAATSVLPLVNAAYDAPDRWAALDALADVFFTNPVVNRASRIQGRTLVASALRVWPDAMAPVVEQRSRECVQHVAPVIGVVHRALGVPRTTTQRLALFGASRAVVSAAVRLGIVGSYEAQRVQSACAAAIEQAVDRFGDVDERDLAQTAPVIDILHGAHDRLYSRLFQS